jgi:hypothetical protein
MEKTLFIEKYEKFKLEEEQLNEYIKTIINFEEYIEKDIEESNVEDIKSYFHYLIDSNQNTYDNVIHITRYYYYIDKKTEYIHMTKYFNSRGVLENIVNRIGVYESKEKQALIMKDMYIPPFGIDSNDLPKYTKDFLDKLNKYLPKSSCNKILAGNNHGIPKESFYHEKELYEKSESLKTYLKERHNRKLEELKKHYDNNLIWFEQVITKEAIEYVASNQEILSGSLDGDKLYITKIPYEINNYLNESDELLKRYYACHCSFVRENILSGKEDISKDWCYCSAGFAKYPFEVIFEQELDVKLLKTPLDGDNVCRFEIDLSNVKYKKNNSSL